MDWSEVFDYIFIDGNEFTRSKWNWAGSGSFGVGAGSSKRAVGVSLEVGYIDLNTNAGDLVTLKYGTVGASISLNKPKIIAPPSKTATLSTAELPDDGAVFRMVDSGLDELQAGDFEGWCLSSQASLSVGMGATYSTILCGMDFAALPIEFLGSLPFFPRRVKQAILNLLGSDLLEPIRRQGGNKFNVPPRWYPGARALLMSKSQSLGVPSGLSFGASLGYISTNILLSSSDVVDIDLPTKEEIAISYRHVRPDDSLIKLSSDILFGFDKDWLGSGDVPKTQLVTYLQRLALYISYLRPRRVFVEGYTDGKGPDSVNQPLSERRAEAVKKVLISTSHLTMPVECIGFGSKNAVALNMINGRDNPAGRKLNRRVVIRLQNS